MVNGMIVKRNRKSKVTVAVLVVAMTIPGMSAVTDVKQAGAAGVKKTGYTLSKAAGTYQSAVKVQIKAKKGYKVYYTLNGTFSLKKLVKSGKKKTVTISKTKTLSVYAVKKTKKLTAKALKKKAKKKSQTYRYVIQAKEASASPAASAVSSPNQTALADSSPTPGQTAEASSSPEASASPEASVAPETSTSPEASVAPETSASPAVGTNTTIDLSASNGEKISDSDTGYTYKKSKKNKLQIMAPGTYTIKGNGETIDGLIIVDFGEKYDSDGDGTDDTSYETSQNATAGSVNIILQDITLTDTNLDYDINQTAEMTSDDGLLKVKSSSYLTGVKLTIQGNVTLKDTGVTGTDKDDATDTTYPAAILSKKTPLEIAGSGTLQVSSENGNGIKSTSSLLIQDTTVLVGTSSNPVGHNGITAKTELETKNADITVYSVKDGIKTTYDEEDYTSSGAFEPTLKITGGNLNIQTKDGDGLSVSYTVNKDTSSEVSYGKAELAPASLNIKTAAASTNSDTADDTVHSNGELLISGGTLNLTAADDGVHADGTLTISNGIVNVLKSFEGLEGNDIVISGGTMDITASDDGINAAGGSDSQSSSQDNFFDRRFGTSQSSSSDGSYKGIKAGSSLVIRAGTITVDTSSTGTKSASMDGGMMNTADTAHTLTISGGNVTIDAEGDGVDSNGSIYMTGGTVIVFGPSNGGNGSIDIGDSSDCKFEVTGGTLWAFAGSADMVVTPTLASPGYVMFNGSIAKGQTVTVKNGDTVIDSVTLQKAAGNIIYYGASIVSGTEYTLYAGSSSVGTATATTVSSGNSGMPGGGGMPGGNGGGPGGNGGGPGGGWGGF